MDISVSIKDFELTFSVCNLNILPGGGIFQNFDLHPSSPSSLYHIEKILESFFYFFFFIQIGFTLIHDLPANNIGKKVKWMTI